jgi:hypothetical protein
LSSPASRDQRARDIRWILDERFSLSAMELWKRDDAAWWGSRGNNLTRGLYEEAMKQLRRLEAVSDAELQAELAAMHDSRLM